MKKVIASFLVICMSFLLCAAASDNACSCGCDCGEQCACGKKELSDAEKEAIYEEVAAKKAAESAGGQSSNVIVIPSSSNQITTRRNIAGNDLPEDLTEPLGDECFVIEACKTTFVERDTYTQMRMEVKVRNLTEYSPPKIYIGLDYTPIDENGDALDRTITMGSTDIAYSGKAQWLEVSCNKDGATGIRILGYRIYGDVDVKGSFDMPIELYSSNYKVSYDEIKGTGN